MAAKEFTIHFPEASTGQANRWSAQLREVLLDTSPEITATQVREHAGTMDWGTVLQVVASSAVLVQAIKSLEAWLIKRRDVTIELSDGQRSLKINGLSAKQAEAKTEAFFQDSPPSGL